jgi:hypothetical protein
LLDLVRCPALRHADQRIGDRAFGVIVELPELTAQRDVPSAWSASSGLAIWTQSEFL